MDVSKKVNLRLKHIYNHTCCYCLFVCLLALGSSTTSSFQVEIIKVFECFKRAFGGKPLFFIFFLIDAYRKSLMLAAIHILINLHID